MRSGEGESSQLVFGAQCDRARFNGTWQNSWRTCASHPRNGYDATFFCATEDALRITQTWYVSSSLFLIESFLMDQPERR